MEDNLDLLLETLQELKAIREENAALSQTIAVQNQQIAEMRPSASYYDVVLNCKGVVTMATLAKDYGWNAARLREWMLRKGILADHSGVCLPGVPYAELGYVTTAVKSRDGGNGKPGLNARIYWTQKGRLFIYEQMKADGVLPLIEQKDEA